MLHRHSTRRPARLAACGAAVVGMLVPVMVLPGVRAATPIGSSTAMVSVNAAGTDAGNGESGSVSASADGNVIAFVSMATDLGPTDTNGLSDVYVRDLLTGVTTLVSVRGTGDDAGNGGSFSPAISADGTTVAFMSEADDLGATDTNGTVDVYVRHLLAGTTELVSVNASGTAAGDGNSGEIAVSADGATIAFSSFSTNLVAGDGNGLTDVFVRDVVAGATTLVSVNSAGTAAGNALSTTPTLSADGTRVAFFSDASDLGPADAGVDRDVYLRDLTAQTTVLVSVNADGTDGALFADDIEKPVISAGGTKVLFRSFSGNYGPPDNGGFDIYVRDIAAGTTVMASHNAAGTSGGNGESDLGTFTGDASQILFRSRASDLGPADAGTDHDIYLRDLVTDAITLVSVNAAGTDGGNGNALFSDISDDGTEVVFQTVASDHGAVDTNGVLDVYVRDLTAGTTTLVTHNAANTDAGNGAAVGALTITPDGTRVAFESQADDLGPPDTLPFSDVFVSPAARPGQISFQGAEFAVDEAAGSAVVAVVRSGGTEGTVSVDFATSDGTAIAGQDYTDADQQVTFAPGQAVATVTVPITADGVADGGETVNLALSNPQGGAELGLPATAVLTITEPDDSAADVVAPGDTVTTDPENDGATPTDPVETAVTSPNPGTVTIQEFPTTGTPPAGFTFADVEVNIEAPPATPQDPLTLVFTLDQSQVDALPPGPIVVTRNGVSVDGCDVVPPDGDLAPDPCLESSVTLGDGDVVLTVLTSSASTWNFGVADETGVGSFLLALSGRSALPAPGGTLTVRDEDIVRFDATAGVYEMVLDGSDVGLGALAIDALAVLDGGGLALSFAAPGVVGDLGKVDDSDVVRFDGTLGEDTAGGFSLLFDGSDVGLTRSGEDVDAVEVRDGHLYLSTTGDFSAASGIGPGISGRAEDVFACRGFVAGDQSSCSSLDVVFTGAAAGLERSSENVDAFSLGADGQSSFFSTNGRYAVNGASGSGNDVFACTDEVAGCDDGAVFETVSVGGDHGLKNNIEALETDLGPLS